MDNGGFDPAYPNEETRQGFGTVTYQHLGLTKLEWYAGQALPAVIQQCAHDTLDRGETRQQMFARKAFAIAHAMVESCSK